MYKNNRSNFKTVKQYILFVPISKNLKVFDANVLINKTKQILNPF